MIQYFRLRAMLKIDCGDICAILLHTLLTASTLVAPVAFALTEGKMNAGL